MAKIWSETKPIASCQKPERDHLFQLLCRSFTGVKREDFDRDFNEKEAVMLLRTGDSLDEIVGFSTLMTLDLPIRGRSVKAVFSGDTVVLEEHRNSTGFGIEIGHYFLRAIELFPEHEIYYILISKGWRTYKVMPFFFKDFSPRHDRAVPNLDQEVMNAFGRVKYPEHYQSQSGLIVFEGETQKIKPGSVDALPVKVDEHTEFFRKCNPRYLDGDELVCVARISQDNFAVPMRRLLGLTKVQGGGES